MGKPCLSEEQIAKIRIFIDKVNWKRGKLFVRVPAPTLFSRFQAMWKRMFGSGRTTAAQPLKDNQFKIDVVNNAVHVFRKNGVYAFDDCKCYQLSEDGTVLTLVLPADGKSRSSSSKSRS